MSFVASYPWLTTTKMDGGLPWTLRTMLGMGLYYRRPLGPSGRGQVEAVGVEWGTEDDRGFRGFQSGNNSERRFARKQQRQEVKQCKCQQSLYSHKHLYNFFIKSRYNKRDAREVLQWIKTVTDDSLDTCGEEDNFAKVLKDGILLCKLVNVLHPGIIQEIHTSRKALKCMQNLSNFLKAVTIVGVLLKEQFQLKDLWEKQNLNAVLICLESLRRKSSQLKNDFGYTGDL